MKCNNCGYEVEDSWERCKYCNCLLNINPSISETNNSIGSKEVFSSPSTLNNSQKANNNLKKDSNDKKNQVLKGFIIGITILIYLMHILCFFIGSKTLYLIYLFLLLILIPLVIKFSISNEKSETQINTRSSNPSQNSTNSNVTSPQSKKATISDGLLATFLRVLIIVLLVYTILAVLIIMACDYACSGMPG